ncbi:MAG: hypothetical protein ABJF25_07405, partial [Rhodopirellula bahusiensis]
MSALSGQRFRRTAYPQAYYRDVLCKMKHPLTGRRLKWTWCVDFFHACEYVSQLAASLFGS